MRTPPRTMPALVTPFHADGELDLEAHRANLQRLWDAEVRGFLLAGSTGEGPYLEPGERELLVATARAEVPEAFLLCGVAGESTRMAVAQAAEAERGGADAVLVVTPTTLARDRHDLVVAHFQAVAEATLLPVLLYSVPPVTAYELPVASILDAGSHPGVVGLKDSGGDPARIPELRPLLDTGFLVYCGASRVIVVSVHEGAYGAITASANYAYHLVAAAVEGDPDAQANLALVAEVVEHHGVAGTKHAANLLGLHAGFPRSPLRPVDDDADSEIARALTHTGLL